MGRHDGHIHELHECRAALLALRAGGVAQVAARGKTVECRGSLKLTARSSRPSRDKRNAESPPTRGGRCRYLARRRAEAVTARIDIERVLVRPLVTRKLSIRSAQVPTLLAPAIVASKLKGDRKGSMPLSACKDAQRIFAASGEILLASRDHLGYKPRAREIMQRPDHPLDFSDPPLHEVVLDVQFEPVPGYTSVHSTQVRELFEAEFPEVAEHPVLENRFETFGGANAQAGPTIHVGGRPPGSRLWFLSFDKDRLVQFQRDRFIANWRRLRENQSYPHFEKLHESFEKNVSKLERHFASDSSCAIEINQVEILYVSEIRMEHFPKIGDWFELWNDKDIDNDNIIISFSEEFKNSSGNHFARLRHEIQSVLLDDNKTKAFKLTLAFKGKPEGRDTKSAMDFLKLGHDAIVNRFGNITTGKAYQHWGRAT